MSINYLYIDDDKTSVVEPMISAITSQSLNGLKIEHTQVLGSISEAIDYIVKNQHRFEGIIIDQDLKAKSEDEKSADYYGTTLAQQLRTDMAISRTEPSKSKLKTMPLVLMSNEEVIVQSFEPDDSSKNLFDYVIAKKKLINESVKSRACKVLEGLIDAYKIANKYRKSANQELNDEEIRNILDCDKKRYEFVDSRFLDYLKPKASDPHALVSAIYSTLVQSAGMLVTEEMLQTKLGIADDSPGWEALKEQQFSAYKYSGPFSCVKERWWFSGIEDWWYEINPDEVLQSLTSKERVDFISKKLEIPKLNPIETRYPNGEQSDCPWVNCVLSGLPLDPYDALRARDPEAKPWEQTKYLDVKAFKDDTTEKYAIHRDDHSKVRLLLARLKPDVNS
ncbi:hypothetical protein NDL37_000540 [Vibrio parahaemolyticus]|nr:hypothetical protein [Vibrio parahaemolyticus]